MKARVPIFIFTAVSDMRNMKKSNSRPFDLKGLESVWTSLSEKRLPHSPGFTRALIFIFATVSDNKKMKKSNSRPFDPNHPLLKDRERLDRILDVMYAAIQKIRFPGRTPLQRLREEVGEYDNVHGVERILRGGSGASADDVLQEAFIGLLQVSPECLRGSWEGLAFRIAENKAKDALDTSQKGLRGTDHRPELHLISGDLEWEAPDGEIRPTFFDTLTSDWGDPEAEFFELDDVLKLRNLAREVLDARELNQSHGEMRRSLG